MSSRLAAHTDDISSKPQTEPLRRTRSQTRKARLTPDSRREMIATAQYHSYRQHLRPPQHSLQGPHHHHQASMASHPENRPAPPELSLDTSFNTSVLSSATFTLSSGGVEDQREDAEEPEAETHEQTHARGSVTGARSPPPESRGQHSTRSERVGEAPAAPPKKKRTRTLTTSHQSSVLLALLAKVGGAPHYGGLTADTSS